LAILVAVAAAAHDRRSVEMSFDVSDALSTLILLISFSCDRRPLIINVRYDNGLDFKKTYMVKGRVNIIKGKGPKSKIGQKGSKSASGQNQIGKRGSRSRASTKGWGLNPVPPNQCKIHQRRIHCKTV